MFTLAGHRTPTIQRMRLAADRSGLPTRMMYAAPNRATTHRLAALDVPAPSWMRAPGECPGPRHGPDRAARPQRTRCRPRGRQPLLQPRPRRLPPRRRRPVRLGRPRPRPGSREENGWLVGTGVASSVYPVNRMAGSTAVIRFERDRYVVEIGAADLGTGTCTTLAQIATDALGVDVDAARPFRDKHGSEPPDGAEADGSTDDNPATERFAVYAFGAQFAQAHVHRDTGEIRVPRLLRVFAAGASSTHAPPAPSSSAA